MWGQLVGAGIGLAQALAFKPHAEVQQYGVQQYSSKDFDFTTAPPPDNSTAVYNRAYAVAVGRMNSLEVMFKGERDITTAKMRGIKERTAIGLSRDEAAANIKLNAAFGGQSGGSVGDALYQTEANAAFRLSDQAVSEQGMIEKGKAGVYKGKHGSYVPKDDYGVDVAFTGGNRNLSTAPNHDLSPRDTSVGGSNGWGIALGALDSLVNNQFMNDLGLAMEDFSFGGSSGTAFGDRMSVPGGMGGV